MLVRKSNWNYYIEEEQVTVWRNCNRPELSQFISFNVYSLQSRKKFKKFKTEIKSSEKKQYDNINDIYGLARKYEIRGTNGYRPTFLKKIAF